MRQVRKQSLGTISGILLPLGLICLFAFCSLALLLTGLRVYRHIQQSSDEMFGTSVAYSYLHTKVSQNNLEGAISVRAEGGKDVLVISQAYGDLAYETRIFYEAGRLRELFVPADMPFSTDHAIAIAAISYCNFDISEEGLLTADLVTEEGEALQMAFSLAGGGGR